MTEPETLAARLRRIAPTVSAELIIREAADAIDSLTEQRDMAESRQFERGAKLAEAADALDALPEPPVYGSEVLCVSCAVVFCPHAEPLHFHHDGCPACHGEVS